jgi:hypothetical protein
MDVLQDVRPQPAAVSLGSLALGESDDDVVTLYSRTGKPFEVSGTSFDPAGGLSVERVAEVEGMPCFRVRQRAVALRWQEQEVRFAVRHASGRPARQIGLKVDYYGVEGSSNGSQ